MTVHCVQDFSLFNVPHSQQISQIILWIHKGLMLTLRLFGAENQIVSYFFEKKKKKKAN